MDHIPKTYRDRRQEHSHTKRNNTTIASGITDKNTVQCNSALVATITSSSAVKDAIRLIKLDITLESTNKYFGTYTFLIKEALLMIADIELVVESLKKLKIT